MPTPPLTAAELAAKVREWIVANDDAGPSAWWLRPDHTHELLADLDRMAATAHADEAPTQKLPPIGETVRRRPPVPPAVRELKGPELLRALADELDRDGLSIADLAGGFEARDAGDYTGCPVDLRCAPGYCAAYGAEGCRMKADER